MHGAIHRITLLGQRAPVSPTATPGTQGEIVFTDDEGHWRSPTGPDPDNPDEPLAPEADHVMGYASFPRAEERVAGPPNLAAVVQVPPDTPLATGADVVVSGAGIHLDGRYEVTGYLPGPVVLRLFLARSAG